MPQGVINLLSGVLPGFVNEVYMALGDLLDILALINNGINFIGYFAPVAVSMSMSISIVNLYSA